MGSAAPQAPPERKTMGNEPIAAPQALPGNLFKAHTTTHPIPVILVSPCASQPTPTPTHISPEEDDLRRPERTKRRRRSRELKQRRRRRRELLENDPRDLRKMPSSPSVGSRWARPGSRNYWLFEGGTPVPANPLPHPRGGGYPPCRDGQLNKIHLRRSIDSAGMGDRPDILPKHWI
eukprot:gene9642-biopygen18229